MVLTRPFTHRPSLMTSTSSLRGEAKEEHNVLLLKTAWQDKVELQEEAGTMNYVTHAMAVLWISRLRGLHLHQCFANGFVYKTTEDGLVHFFLYKTSLYKATVYLLSWRTESRIWDITSVLVLYWFLLVFDPDTLGTPLEVQSTQSLSETSRQISTFFPFRRSAAERITRWSCVHGQRMSQSSRGHMIRRTDLISRGHMIRRTDSDLMLVVKDDFRECHYCDKDFQRKGPYSKMCSGCKKVRYCSVDCQKSHWKLHRPFCKLTTWQIIAVRSVV